MIGKLDLTLAAGSTTVTSFTLNSADVLQLAREGGIYEEIGPFDAFTEGKQEFRRVFAAKGIIRFNVAGFPDGEKIHIVYKL